MKKLFFILAFLVFANQPAKAQEINNYKLCNHHKFTYFKLKIYDIYLCGNQSKISNYQNLYNQDFALIIKYDIKIKREKFAESSMEEIARYYQLGPEKQKNYHNQLLNIFVDVHSKDEIRAFYKASGETKFYYNNKEIGKITDKDFSKIFMDIWLHPKSHYRDMRNDLLKS